MIYITGDTHGDRLKFKDNNMGDELWTGDDCLIVCGDFGYIFRDDQKEKEYLDFLETKPYTICFCDGNHENFDALFAYPLEEWNGGKVHKIRENIYHLMRGQVFEIQGKTIFTMGGAYSIDRATKAFWEAERPTLEEYAEAYRNLETHGNKADIVITHTAPNQIICRMGHSSNVHDMALVFFLDWVMFNVQFSKWYFGHWHEDHTFNNLWSFSRGAEIEKLNGKITAVYEAVHCIPTD